jgi:hypothetical protein
VRGAHLSDVMHEQEFCEVIVDAGALQVFAGAEMLPRASAARPIVSCIAARADHTPHHSSHDVIEAATSSKSASATPFATKRGAQCAMAEVIRASFMTSDVRRNDIDRKG